MPDATIRSHPSLQASDHTGEYYAVLLSRLHDVLLPKSYLEIGVLTGATLKYARCPSIGIDPNFAFRDLPTVTEVLRKPELHLFQMGSDEFFASHSPTAIFGRPVEMAFLDGMHRCEFLLRDFSNIERHCKKNSIVALHDCLPVETGIATRMQEHAKALAEHHAGWWTGDVWRTALLLKRRRRDLAITAIDAAPTGLLLISNLDPASTMLQENYHSCVSEMLSWDLAEIGVDNLFSEMNVTPASALRTAEGITGRFWL